MNCPSEMEFNRRLQQNEDRCKSNTHRIDKLEQSTEAISQLAANMAVMVEKQDRVADAVDKLDGKVTVLESKPAKRWDGLVDKLILVVATALVTWLLTQVGIPV